MPKIEKIREGLYVKKSFDGYRVIYPYKNDDDTLNWFNIVTGGSYWKLVKIAFIVFVILGLSFFYARDTRVCRHLLSNPCYYLPNITAYCSQQEQDKLFPDLLPDLNQEVMGDGEG